MDEIDLVFTEVAAAAGRTLTIDGDTSLVVQSVSTTDNINALTIDNNLTGATTTFTVTGASPAINLHADTATFNIAAANDSNTVLGTESDDAATAAVEPSITGSGLTTIAVTGGNAATSVALGAVSGVADTLTISDAVAGRTVPTSVQLDNIPSTADWTLDRLALTVNEGATIGAGSALTLANNTTIASGSVGLDSLPISADSTLVVDSTYTAAEITALMDTVDAARATVTVTGMSTAQLQAVAAADNKVAGADGTLSIDNSLTADEISALLVLGNQAAPANTVDWSAAGNAAYAVVTGMTADQLNAVGGTTDWAADGVSGTITLTKDVTAGSITAILDDAIRSSTMNVDATGMSAGQLTAVAGDIGQVDAITNLSLDVNQTAAEIETLTARSSGVTVNATGMSAGKQ